MKTSKKFGFGIAAAIYTALLTAGTLLILLPAPEVSAQSVRPDELCIPPVRELNNDYSVETGNDQGDGRGEHFDQGGAGWLTVEVINRATFKLSFNPDGKKCERPPNVDLRYIAVTDKSGIFKKLVDGTLIDGGTNDTDWNYVKKVGESGKDDTVLDNFRADRISTKDQFGGGDKTVTVAEFRQAIDHSEILISIENDRLDGIADCQAGGDSGTNMVLRRHNNALQWRCERTINGDWTGITLRQGAYISPENFNITYNVVGSGPNTVIEHVSPGERDTRTFSWCTALGEFRSENCRGPLYFDKSVTPDSLAVKKSDTFNLQMKKNGTSNTLQVVLAGSATKSAQQTPSTGSDSNQQDPSGDDTDSAECVVSSGEVFEWILCPVITALSEGTDKLNGLIESQLYFDVKGNLSDNDAIAAAWSVIRIIATASLVIIMLVMVISQAVGGGLFDAYTVRKMLPKLVVATILVQISWDMSKWFITLANDAGSGIAQLLAAPFGGPGNLDLGSLLERLSGVWAGVTSITLVAFLLAAPFLTYLFLPGVAMIAFSIFLSVLIAFTFLMFRNVLIVGCVIFAPIALLAWILPGTQKYWRTWIDNFTKLLLLFPLIISLIYLGRIFAWVVADAGNPGPIDLLMVLVGFFGPYFLVPQSFKWGGSMMRIAQDQTNKSWAVRRARETGGKVIKEDFGQYWRGKQSRDLYSPYDPDKIRTSSRGPRILPWRGGRKGLIPWAAGRGIGRLASGHWLPTARGQAQTIEEGRKWAEQQGTYADIYNRRMFELAMEKGYAVDDKDQVYLPKDPRNAGRTPKILKDSKGSVILGKDGQPKKAEWQPGIGAAKQALVDNTSTWNVEGDRRKAKNAVGQLVDTSSNPEFENSLIARGPDAGKRVFEVQYQDAPLYPWEEQIGGNQQQYPATIKSNFDLVPHVKQYKYPTDPSSPYYERARRAGINPGERYSDADRSLYAIDEDMALDDFSTQSLGFWQRQVRNAKEAKLADGNHDTRKETEIGNALLKRFEEMLTLGPENAAAVLRPLRGGDKEKAVNELLAMAEQKSADGRNLTLDDIVSRLHGNGGGQGGGGGNRGGGQGGGGNFFSTGQGQVNVRYMGGSTVPPPSVEVKIDHEALGRSIGNAMGENVGEYLGHKVKEAIKEAHEERKEPGSPQRQAPGEPREPEPPASG